VSCLQITDARRTSAPVGRALVSRHAGSMYVATPRSKAASRAIVAATSSDGI
jgi:hypothetical protein